MLLTHADRELWPGVSKRALAAYWEAVAAAALPGIARRPRALLRCPDRIDGQRFFQKHGAAGMPEAIRAFVDGAPIRISNPEVKPSAPSNG